MNDLPDDTVPDDASEFEASVEPVWDRKPWRRPFIESLSRNGNVSFACREAGIGRWTVYQDYKHESAFRQAWERAKADHADYLEAVALKRATGYKVTKEKYKIDADGNRFLVEVVVEDQISDSMLAMMLRAAKPEKYRETTRVEVGGIDGEAIKVEPVRPRTPERLAELMEIVREQELSVIEQRQIESSSEERNGDEAQEQ